MSVCATSGSDDVQTKSGAIPALAFISGVIRVNSNQFLHPHDTRAALPAYRSPLRRDASEAKKR